MSRQTQNYYKKNIISQSNANNKKKLNNNYQDNNSQFSQVSKFFNNEDNLSSNEEKKEINYVIYDSKELRKNISSFKGNPQEKLYLISKEDYIKGLKLKSEINNNLKKLNQGTTMIMNYKRDSSLNKVDFKFYSKYNDFQLLLNSNLNFVFIKYEYLNSLVINPDKYKEKEIILIQNEGKKFLLFKDNILLDISGKENPNSIPNSENSSIKDNVDMDDNENKNKIVINDVDKNSPKLDDEKVPYIFDINSENKNIVENLILIYAFEKNITDLIKSSIKDEYDWNEYYLINKRWIETYKDIFNFNDVKNYLDNKKYEFNYKGYLIHLDDLVERIQKKNFFKSKNYIKEVKKLQSEEEFLFCNLKELNIENGEDISFPSEFVLVSERIIDVLIKINYKSKDVKENYKYSILIGDNALFIKDKKNKNIFYIYELNKDNILDISILFKYKNDFKFYDEIKRFIKDKGIMNYISERKIEIMNKGKICGLLDSSGDKIGEYINFKQLSYVEIRKIKIKNNFNKNIILFKNYQKFIKSLSELKDKEINISNIKDILNKRKDDLSVDYKKIFLIMKNHMDYLTNSLYFKQIEKITKITDKEEYKEEEEKIINNLLKTNDIDEDEDTFRRIKLLNKKDFGRIIKQNYPFTFMDPEFLNNVNDSLENELNPLESYFFINKGEHFVYFFDYEKLFKLEYKNKSINEFYLKEYEFNKESKIILEFVKKIYQNENDIKANILTKLRNMTNSENYHLINRKFMENFKLIYNYDKIIQIINYDNSALSYLNKNKDKYTINSNNIQPQNYYHINTNLNIPINFDLLDTETFGYLLNYIIKKNEIIENINNIYNVSFGDNKLFIQDISNKELNLIYSHSNDNNNNINYELLYIIIMDNNQNLLNLLKYCDYNLSFEEFITIYGINLTETEPQVILDEDINKLGDFYNIKAHNRIRLREPKHCLGLENIGATCYMNATIQCLCHVLNVKNYFKKRQSVYKDTINKNCPLTRDFYKVVNNLWKESYRGKKYYTPTDFKNRISIMNPLFKGIAANDSKDLILFLYETMHNEINKINQYTQNNNYNNNTELQMFRNNYYSKNSSFLIKTFYFEQQSDLKCLFCNFSKSSYNITNILIFPLEKVREYLVKKNPNGFWSVTLENCFENYQEPEILSGMNQIYCNNCRRQANASTRNSMFTSPEVLTIILNRGKGLEFQVEFEYPLNLNLDKFVNDKNSNNKYELIAVLTHIGPSGMAGHFIAFCKSPVDDTWYCYNDADVQEVIDPRTQNNEQIEGIPYVLYYQKYNSNKKIEENDYNKNLSYNYQEKMYYNVKQSKYSNEDKYKKYKNKNSHDGGNDWKNKYYNNDTQITLYFLYNDKEVYLDISKNEKFYYIIKKLTDKYKRIPKNIILCYQEGENMTTLEETKTPNNYGLTNNDKIIVIDKY